MPRHLLIPITLLFLLVGCTGQRTRMEQVIREAKEQNKNYIPFTTDSLLREAVDYYDRHGTANERLRARYLLGCAYRDLHEAPLAIITWEDAIACADTLSADCDYDVLSRVYAQMSYVYHRQLLFSNEIRCLKKYSQTSWLAKDTFYAINALNLLGGTYISMNKRDSAERILERVQNLYRKYGYHQEALLSSTMLVSLYVTEKDKLEKAKHLMDRYESESEDFDENHVLTPSKRQYYRYKGLYYEQAGLLDSAEYCYRKIYRPNMSFVSLDPMYHGLLSVFRKKGLSDSIAKYALLYCEANDSSIAITDRELSVQVASLYNYNRLQEESLRQKSKAQAMKYWLLISITVLTYSIVFFVWNRRQQQRRIQKQLTELRALGNELSRSIEAREHLRAMYEASFSLYNDRLNSFQEEVLAHKGQLRLAQKEYDKLRQSHENTEQVLSKQICELELRIDVLKKQAGLSEDALISMNLQSENSVRLLKRIIRSSRSKLTEGLWNRLFQTVGLYYPKLIQDILQSDGISPLGIRIIILLGPLHLSNKEIIGLLEISNQTLTNTKEDINQVLFGEHSARPLYKNLVSQYRLYKQ